MTTAAPAMPTTDPRAPRSGLVYLRDCVDAYFKAAGVAATVAPVGLKYRFFTLNQSPANANRVVFIPGEFDGTPDLRPRKYGTLSRGTDNSASVQNPRELLHWDRSFTISVWAAPAPGHGEDEQESIARAEDLLEQVIRALANVPDPDPSETGTVGASFHLGDVTIQSPPNDKSFGAELLVGGVLDSPFFDVTLDVVTPGLVLPRPGA